MTDQLCPVCGCSIVEEGYEKDGVKYCCEPCADGGGPCDCGCCHPVEDKSNNKEGKMETFHGKGHLPGAPELWDVELDADWEKKEFTVRIPAARANLTEWPGLMVQTIGAEEAVFRTRGIPPLQIHWWHVVKNKTGGLWAMVLVPPNEEGVWLNCGLRLEKKGD